MIRKALPVEFVYQAIALFLSVIIVHGVYVSVIWPRADAVLAEQRALIQANKDAEVQRSVYVILRDYEQEVCFVLMLWAFAIMAFKGVTALRERSLLAQDLVPIPEGTKVLPEDAKQISRKVQALPRHLQALLLPRALLLALHRFESTRSIQDVSTATHTLCETESDRLDSELSMIRYIAWAIPSVGFIGTVRGIGEALGQAHKAVEGDVTGVTQSLGTAFNSTLVALLISIVVMFVVHQLQLTQERLVLDTEDYCDQRLIRHMQTQQ
jgi:biopolymer transport protein ExbB/TolQ